MILLALINSALCDGIKVHFIPGTHEHPLNLYTPCSLAQLALINTQYCN